MPVVRINTTREKVGGREKRVRMRMRIKDEDEDEDEASE